MEVIEKLKICPDVVHCNDWQTGLIPVYIKTKYAGRECFKKYKNSNDDPQYCISGDFLALGYEPYGVRLETFNWKQLEFYGKLNFLKGGIVFSDLITTVSKTYAKEIQTPEYGAGLDGVLKERANDLYGIINGIDYSIWNPETDKYIVANYGIKNLRGKQLCKKALQRKYNLPERDVPVIGMITRLIDQKAWI